MGANILGFNGFVLLVVGDVLIDSETLMVTSSFSSRGFAGSAFESAHRGRDLCVYIHRGECAFVVSVCVV
jgi:hypothetical protein